MKRKVTFTVGNDPIVNIIKRRWRIWSFVAVICLIIFGGLYLLVNSTHAEPLSDEILLPVRPSPQTPTPAVSYDYRRDPLFDCFPDRAEYSAEVVTALQKRLTEYGYYTPITGRFDEDTGMSVKKFQLDYGLACDGIVGDTTYDMLNFNTDRWSFSSMWYTADLKHVAYVTPCEFIIYANCGDDPHVTVYHKTEDGWRKTFQVACVVGASTEYENITPLGYHEIWSADDYYFEHGGFYYYNPVFYTVCDDPETDSYYESQYGIHSVAYDPNSRAWEDWVLDRNYYPTGKLTNGCVRVDPNAATWIQNHRTVGTPVVIDDRSFAEVNRPLS